MVSQPSHLLVRALAALNLDPLEAGLQILDVRSLVPALDAEHRVPRTHYAAPNANSSQDPDGAWSEVQGIGPYTPPWLPFPLVPARPALICRLGDREVVRRAQQCLLQRYPHEHPVVLVHIADAPDGERVWSSTLGELDRQAPDAGMCAYLAPLAPLDDLRGPEGAALIVARLLGPRGCPWDREQTHRSLRAALLEEVHEVLEAIDADDMRALAEELGDVLLGVLMHSEMARQAGAFDLGDVYQELATKLIRRHPHIFGQVQVSGSSQVLQNWEAIKQSERAAREQEPRGALDGIPAGLPALMVAQELSRKAAKTGFEWPAIDAAWDKLWEEMNELRESAAAEYASDAARARSIEAELGDVLFALAGLARWLKLDSESALRAANARFRRRFAYVEQQTSGRPLKDVDLDEMIRLWNQAKAYDD